MILQFRRKVDDFEGTFELKGETLALSLLSLKKEFVLFGHYSQDNLPSQIMAVFSSPKQLYDAIEVIPSQDLKVSEANELILIIKVFGKVRQFPLPLQKTGASGEDQLRQENILLKEQLQRMSSEMGRLYSDPDASRKIAEYERRIQMLEMEIIEGKKNWNYQIQKLRQLLMEKEQENRVLREEIVKLNSASKYQQNMQAKQKFSKAAFKYEQINSIDFGGKGGFAFRHVAPSPKTMELRVLKIYCGGFVDSLQLFFSDESNNLVPTPKAGGNGGNQYGWTVPAGQYVSKIIAKTGGFVDSIQFVTNTGQKSPIFGGKGGEEKVINIPAGYRIVGFFGKSGRLIDRIGFVLGSRP